MKPAPFPTATLHLSRWQRWERHLPAWWRDWRVKRYLMKRSIKGQVEPGWVRYR